MRINYHRFLATVALGSGLQASCNGASPSKPVATNVFTVDTTALWHDLQAATISDQQWNQLSFADAYAALQLVTHVSAP